MTYLTSRRFWAGAAERAIKTAAYGGIALVGADGSGLLSITPARALVLVGGPALLSVLGSLASGSIGDTGSASLVEDRPADAQGAHVDVDGDGKAG